MGPISILDKDLLATVAINADRLVDTATKLGVAYVGYKANNHWSGALTGLVALKLSGSPNLASGIAGTGTLAALGLLNMSIPSSLRDLSKDPLITQHVNDPDWWGNYGFQRAWG